MSLSSKSPCGSGNGKICPKNIVVPKVQDLASLGVSRSCPCASAKVQSLECTTFVLDREDTQVPDGITITAAKGTGAGGDEIAIVTGAPASGGLPIAGPVGGIPSWPVWSGVYFRNAMNLKNGTRLIAIQ